MAPGSRVERMEFRRRRGSESGIAVTIPQALAWRVFTKGIDYDSARREIHVEGDLGEKALRLKAIVA